MKNKDQIELEKAYSHITLLENAHEDRSHIKSVSIASPTINVQSCLEGIPKQDEKYFYGPETRSVPFEWGESEMFSFLYKIVNQNLIEPEDSRRYYRNLKNAISDLKSGAPENAEWFIWHVGKRMHLGYEDFKAQARKSLHKQLGDDDELDLKGLFDNI